MKIKSAEIKYFKCIANRNISFGNVNDIRGRNGSGKTSIRDAIILALYNTTHWGGKDTGKLISNNKSSAEVTLEMEDGRKIYRKKRKHKTELEVDDQGVAQKDFENKFYNFEVFSSVFNVGYFLTLPESTQREIFLQFLPPYDKNQAFEELGYNKEILEKYSIDLNSEESIDALKQTIKELESDISSTDTKIEAKEEEIDTLLLDIKEYEKEYGYLRKFSNQDKDEYVFSAREKSLHKEVKDKIKAKKKELEEAKKISQAHDDYNTYLKQKKYYEDVSQLYKDKRKRLKELEKLLKENDLDETEKTIIKLEKELKKDKYAVPAVPTENKCPVCLTKITQDKREDLVEEIEIRRQERNAVESSLKEAREILDKIQDLQKEKSQIEKELENEPEEPEKVAKPEQEEPNTDKLQEELSELMKQANQREAYEKFAGEQKEKITKLKKQKRKLKKDLESFKEMKKEMDQVKEALRPSNINSHCAKQQVQHVETLIKQYLPNNEIEFVLEEELKSKTGFKEVFRVRVDGVDYRQLSTGEQKILSMGLSKTLDDLLEEPIGMYFVDNYESVSFRNRFGLVPHMMFSGEEDQLFYTTVDKESGLQIN